MKQIKWIFVLYSILSAACIAGIGVAVAERSIYGAICCIIGVALIMGMGFSAKRKMREHGQL